MSQVRRLEMFGSHQSRLADKADEVRARKRRICNVIHNSAWVVESSTFLAYGMLQILTNSIDPYLLNCLSDTLTAFIFARIIVPFTHLFNEHRIKIIVLDYGWLCAMKQALQFKVVSEESQPDRPERKSQKIGIIPRFVLKCAS